MKLTINRITLLFGLIVFVDFFFFENFQNIFYLPIIYAVCAILGILSRSSSKTYAYWRGLLIGFRVLSLGAILAIILSAITVFFKTFKPSSGNMIDSIQGSLIAMFSHVAMILPQLIIVLTFSIFPMLIIPLFFLRKSKQTDNIIDADFINDEK